MSGAHEDGIWAAAWAEGAPSTLLTGSVDETVKLWGGDDLHAIRTNVGNSLGVCPRDVKTWRNKRSNGYGLFFCPPALSLR